MGAQWGPPPERRKGPAAATSGPFENTSNSNDGRENMYLAPAVKPVRELDRRFAQDLSYLIDVDGVEETAWAVLDAAERVGLRGALEEEISRRIWRRHPGRRPTLAVFVNRSEP
jgi:hypothetical protein